MRIVIWTAVGFVVGVAATSAAVLVVPSPWLLTAAERMAPPSPAATGTKAQTPVAEAKDPGPNYVIDNGPTDPGPINADPLGDLDVGARVAILRFMAANPAYEFITRDWCGCHDIAITNCPEYDAERARQLADYPYSDALDYNGDSVVDFALMLSAKGGEGPSVLFIFNGPFGDDIPRPAFKQEGWARNDRLLGDYVGTPESDNGYRIEAKGASYALAYLGDPQ